MIIFDREFKNGRPEVRIIDITCHHVIGHGSRIAAPIVEFSDKAYFAADGGGKNGIPYRVHPIGFIAQLGGDPSGEDRGPVLQLIIGKVKSGYMIECIFYAVISFGTEPLIGFNFAIGLNFTACLHRTSPEFEFALGKIPIDQWFGGSAIRYVQFVGICFVLAGVCSDKYIV